MARSAPTAAVATAAAALVVAGALAPPAAAQPGFGEALERYSGPDRYETAARLAVDSGAFVRPDVAVVARGDSPFDALSAAALGGPVLLTRTGALPDATRDALADLGPGRVVVAGGPAAVSDAVLAEIDAVVAGPVRRVFGPNRYATAAALASEVGASTDRTSQVTALLATGQNFADALSAGSLSCLAQEPVLLTERDALPRDTVDALADLGVDQVVVLGGIGAVSDDVVAELQGLGLAVERLAGQDRYATAALIQDRGLDEGVINPQGSVVVRGDTFPDALGAGAAACASTAPLYLVRPGDVPPATGALVDTLADSVLFGSVVGGTGAVSEAVRDEVARRGEGPGERGERSGAPELVDVVRVVGRGTFLTYDQPVEPGVVEPFGLVGRDGTYVGGASDVRATVDPRTVLVDVARAPGTGEGDPFGDAVRLEDVGGLVTSVDGFESVAGVIPLDPDPSTTGPTLVQAAAFVTGVEQELVLELSFDEQIDGAVVDASAVGLVRFDARGLDDVVRPPEDCTRDDSRSFVLVCRFDDQTPEHPSVFVTTQVQLRAGDVQDVSGNLNPTGVVPLLLGET